ncbi:MAG: hypothetical protein DI603_13585 [Roseateles depolymerans]|uniref:Uncharacterized protein n=1 Tax=Roseateles depolymerans TaxID=76731 RepID=A0A2W5DGC2_9BURK|nr:MAG: hypothetical protein DI603_13585 [Roseateles depolymerans]
MNAPARAGWALLAASLALTALALGQARRATEPLQSPGEAQALHRIAQLQRLNDAADQTLLQARQTWTPQDATNAATRLGPLETEVEALSRSLEDTAPAEGLDPVTASAIAGQRRLWAQYHDEAGLLSQHELVLADALRRGSLPRALAYAQERLAMLGHTHLARRRAELRDLAGQIGLGALAALLACAAALLAWRRRHGPDPAPSPFDSAQLEQAAAVTRRLQTHVACCCTSLRLRMEALGLAEHQAHRALRERPVAQGPLALQQLAQRLEDALAQSHELNSLALIITTPWTRRLVTPPAAPSRASVSPDAARLDAVRRQAAQAATETSRLAVQVLARLQSSQEQLQRQATDLPRLPWTPPELPAEASRQALIERSQRLARQLDNEARRLRPLAEPTS